MRLFAAVALACVALTACSGGEEPDALEPPARAATPTVTVTDDAATDAASPEETATPATIEDTPPVASPLPAAVEEAGARGKIAMSPAPTELPDPTTTPTRAPMSTPAPSRETNAKTDREALIVFHEATDGPNWVNNENWLSDAPTSAWHGVDTDPFGRVRQLDLQENGLVGHLPPGLANLTNLTRLLLGDNRLSGNIPSELGNLSKLRELELWSNRLSGAIPPELGNLSNLEALDLSQNQLSGNVPSELGNLSKLRELELWTNRLSGNIPSELGSLSNLRWLFLWSNRLGGAIPPELANLSNLEVLELGNNKLSGEIPPELGNLSKLEVLHLWTNRLSGEIPSELGGVPNLSWLLLWSNRLSGAIPPELGNLSNLEVLDLSQNQLSGEIPPELGNLYNLEVLELGNNKLSGGAIPPELGNLSNLEVLELRDNNLTGEIPPELANLYNLEKLYLKSGNQLSGCIPTALRSLRVRDLDYCDEASEIDDTTTPAPSSEETAAPATAEVSAVPGCDEQIHECVLDDFGDIWGGYSGIHPSKDALGKINLYFYTGAIYPDDKDVEWNKAFEYLYEAERVLPRIERRMGVSFTGELHIMIYENWNAMKHFAPDPDVELPSLTLGRDTLVINHDHDDVVGTIQREIGRMVQEDLSVDEGSASTTPTPVPTSTPTPSRETSAETDREALIALYEATDGPNWVNNENWLSDVPTDDWHRVDTDAGGRVVRLNLSYSQLSDEIPSELGNLSNLVGLELWDNRLSGCIPAVLQSSQLIDLDEMGLHYCDEASEVDDTT